jgi:endoglucanase
MNNPSLRWRLPCLSINFFWQCICTLCLMYFGMAQASCLDQKQLLGVNLSGAEFGQGPLPGVLNKDYIYPSRKDLGYFHTLGMNVVRVPFRWERIQRKINEPLDPSELEQLRQVVFWAQNMNMCVILDLHNFGTYQGRVLGSADLPTSAFIDVWLRLHKAFDNPDETAFGLMNEPAAITVPQWITIAQKTVLALREDGARNLLIIGSGRWSGAHEWATVFDGVSAANGFRNFRDPMNNFAIELHQYADANYSGTGTTCIDPDRLRNIMTRVATWAKQEKKRVYLGEFGVGPSNECLAALKTIVESMQDADAWLGWTYWSAGPWWGNYAFSIQPGSGIEAPQLTVLRNFLPKNEQTQSH